MGINKEFGTKILITSAVKQASSGSIETRKVATVAQKGRDDLFDLYELVSEGGTA